MIDHISLVAVPADTTAAVLLVRYLVEGAYSSTTVRDFISLTLNYVRARMCEEVTRKGTTNTASRDQALGGLYLLSEAHILLMASIVEAASSCCGSGTTSISC